MFNKITRVSTNSIISTASLKLATQTACKHQIVRYADTETIGKIFRKILALHYKILQWQLTHDTRTWTPICINNSIIIPLPGTLGENDENFGGFLCTLSLDNRFLSPKKIQNPLKINKKLAIRETPQLRILALQ